MMYPRPAPDGRCRTHTGPVTNHTHNCQQRAEQQWLDMAHTLRSVGVFTTAPATTMEHSNASSTTVNGMADPITRLGRHGTYPASGGNHLGSATELSRRSQQHMAVAGVCTIAWTYTTSVNHLKVQVHTRQWGCLLAPGLRSTSTAEQQYHSQAAPCLLRHLGSPLANHAYGQQCHSEFLCEV
jgi:hypothetical protein